MTAAVDVLREIADVHNHLPTPERHHVHRDPHTGRWHVGYGHRMHAAGASQWGYNTQADAYAVANILSGRTA